MSKTVIEITRWNAARQMGWAVASTQEDKSEEYLFWGSHFKTHQGLARAKVGARYLADLAVSPLNIRLAINIEEQE